MISERGRIQVRALVTAAVGTGQVFLSMHHDVTNLVTMPAFDPHSRQPAYKHAAVDVVRC